GLWLAAGYLHPVFLRCTKRPPRDLLRPDSPLAGLALRLAPGENRRPASPHARRHRRAGSGPSGPARAFWRCRYPDSCFRLDFLRRYHCRRPSRRRRGLPPSPRGIFRLTLTLLPRKHPLTLVPSARKYRNPSRLCAVQRTVLSSLVHRLARSVQTVLAVQLDPASRACPSQDSASRSAFLPLCTAAALLRLSG